MSISNYKAKKEISAADVLVGLVDGKPKVLICMGLSEDEKMVVARAPRVNSREYALQVVSLGRNKAFGSEGEYLLNGQEFISVSLCSEIMKAAQIQPFQNLSLSQLKLIQKYISTHASMFKKQPELEMPL